MSKPARVRAAAGLLVLLTVSACQIGPGELFSVVNGTDETVVVKWNDAVYATLPPGRMTATALPEGYCEQSRGDRFTATSDSGRQYRYQGRVCNGNTWKLPSPGG